MSNIELVTHLDLIFKLNHRLIIYLRYYYAISPI